MTDQVVEIKRKGGVARVKLASGDMLKIPSAVYLERRLRPGQAVDPEAYRAFIRQNGEPHALEIAVNSLALRDRSEGELVSRLRRSCYDEETIARVMAKLQQHDLISDARFAAAWAETRGRKYGRGRIAQELRQKGVSEENARAALDVLTEEEELYRATQQAAKLARRMENDPRKIVQALMRRGYAYSLARRAAEQAMKKHE